MRSPCKTPPGSRAWKTAKSFKDRSVSDFYSEVIVHEDCEGRPEWIVDYFDDDGGCYVTIFAGPECEKRARDYFHALKSKRLTTIRTPEPYPAGKPRARRKTK